jgi:hypothetical protein
MTSSQLLELSIASVISNLLEIRGSLIACELDPTPSTNNEATFKVDKCHQR